MAYGACRNCGCDVSECECDKPDEFEVDGGPSVAAQLDVTRLIMRVQAAVVEWADDMVTAAFCYRLPLAVVHERTESHRGGVTITMEVVLAGGVVFARRMWIIHNVMERKWTR